ERNFGLVPHRQQPVERRAGIGGIVVTPPELGRPARRSPQHDLLVEGAPAAHTTRAFSSSTVTSAPRASQGGRSRIEGPAMACAIPWARLAADNDSPDTTVTRPRSASRRARSLCSVSRSLEKGTRT